MPDNANAGPLIPATGQGISFPGRVARYFRFTRPFTLLPPMLGMISGAVTALGALAQHQGRDLIGQLSSMNIRELVWFILLGAALASTLNAASNVLNQIFDLQNDRINKPERMLPSGKISVRAAALYAAVLYGAVLWMAWSVAPQGRHECFWIVLLAAAMTYVYSGKPFRSKRNCFAANLTIAVPRGCLLKVAGWSCVAPVATDVEPWYIGGIFFLFLLGATTAKDYSDMEGDRAAGCITLPLRYGVNTSARMIAPFFVLPWVFMPLGLVLRKPGGELPILSGNPFILASLGVFLAFYGAYTAWLILRNPESMAQTENHPSWTHMYLLMMCAQGGFALAYMI